MSAKTYRYRKVRRETRLSDVSLSSDDEACESYYVFENDKQEAFSTMEDKRMSTFSISMFLLNCMFVPAFYTLQRSFASIGWYAILVGLIAIMILCYTSILLSQTQDKMIREESSAVGRRDVYPFIIETSLGKTAGTVFMVLFNILLLCLCIGIMSFMSDLFQRLIPPTHGADVISVDNQKRLWCIAVTMVVLPLTLLNSPKSYWFLGNASGVLSLLTVSIVVAVLISYLVNNNQVTGPGRLHLTKFNSFLEVCSYISLLIFSFGFHPFLPTLQLDSNKPRHIPSALLATSMIGSFSFLICSSLAYAVFGTDLGSSLFENLFLQEVTVHNYIDFLLLRICTVMMLLQGVVAYSITVTPLNNVAESLLGQTDLDFSFGVRVLVRVLTTVIVAVLSVLLPHFVPILIITSGLLLSVFDVILPIVCYTVYTKPNQSYIRLGFHVFIITLTLVSSTMAIYSMAKNIYWITIGQRSTY